MNNLLQTKRRGSTIVMAVLMLVILLATGVGLLSLGLNRRVYSLRNAQEIQARCAADAGLVKAVFELNNKLKTNPKELDSEAGSPSFPEAKNEALPSSDASFSYQITTDSVFAKMNGQDLAIESIGKGACNCVNECTCPTAKVRALVRLQNLFDSAMLVKNQLSLMPNTKVGAYNSADPTDTDFNLKLGTTSTASGQIPLGPGTVIDGDVFVGIGGDPEVVVGAGGTINGDKYSLTEEPYLPAITPPSLTDTGKPLLVNGGTVTIGAGDSGKYTGIDVASGVLEINGGRVVLHITGDIKLGVGCQVTINSGSSLVIYTEGNILAGNSAGFNNQGSNVRDFQLYTVGTNTQVFDLRAKSSIFGLVYAPDVDVVLYPSTEVRGAIVGKSLQLKSGCTFYYDEVLRDNVSLYDVGASFGVKRWQEE
ncbi:MAG: DUF7305 domain-containing protein [Planctomycetota bacterium]|jgi:cytoskeletal protein CcmA (bactofilin family)